jgi:hypothetical protein
VKPDAATAPSSSFDESGVHDLEVEATPTTGIIRGIVVDAAIRPLAGARVVLVGSAHVATTNQGGAFGFEDLQPGTYFVEASMANFTSIQSSANVVAGEKQPTPLRMMLAAKASTKPYIEATKVRIMVTDSVSYWNPATGQAGNGTTTRNLPVVPVGNNATVVQAEWVWTPSTALAAQAKAVVAGRIATATIRSTETSGPSPLVLRIDADAGQQAIDNVQLDTWARGSSGTPVGVMVDQEMDAYVHVFYNLVPRADWQFSKDGDYPL